VAFVVERDEFDTEYREPAEWKWRNEPPRAVERRLPFGIRPAPVARASAGGRVNLIGEHTDYHEGFVLPAAIDLRTVALGAPRVDGLVRIRSLDLGAEVSSPSRTCPAGCGGLARLRARAVLGPSRDRKAPSRVRTCS